VITRVCAIEILDRADVERHRRGRINADVVAGVADAAGDVVAHRGHRHVVEREGQRLAVAVRRGERVLQAEGVADFMDQDCRADGAGSKGSEIGILKAGVQPDVARIGGSRGAIGVGPGGRTHGAGKGEAQVAGTARVVSHLDEGDIGDAGPGGECGLDSRLARWRQSVVFAVMGFLALIGGTAVSGGDAGRPGGVGVGKAVGEGRAGADGAAPPGHQEQRIDVAHIRKYNR
jgi:hypothetical protein